MRRPLMLLFGFAIVVMTARAVSASTDCQKWLADYKKTLAEKTTPEKLLAAKHRARAYAHRKIVQLTSAPVSVPKPHPTRISSVRPHLTPAQMLKRFDLLCGDLPVDPTPQVLDARMAPDEFISEMSMGGPVDSEGVPEDNSLIAVNEPPSFTSSASVPDTPPGSPYAPPPYGPVFGGPGKSGGPGTPPPVPPPVAPVPEPGSLFLMLTGGAGAFAAIRRRVSR